jgi:hypothetical protein
MGFDISARNKKTDYEGYFRANVFYMSFLRIAMEHAGVPEQVLFPAFCCNNGYYVTSKDACMIAERLLAWLQNKNLMLIVDSKYDDPDSVFVFLESKSSPRVSLIIKRIVKGKKRVIYHVAMTRIGRKRIKDFASFCATSRGLWIY